MNYGKIINICSSYLNAKRELDTALIALKRDTNQQLNTVFDLYTGQVWEEQETSHKYEVERIEYDYVSGLFDPLIVLRFMTEKFNDRQTKFYSELQREFVRLA